MIFKIKERKKEKVSHNNGLIPTYETNKKQTDQTEDTTQERKMKREQKKNQTQAERSHRGVFGCRHLHSAADMKATLLLPPHTLFFLFKMASAAWLF